MGKYTEYTKGPFPEKKVRVSHMGPLSPRLRKFLMYHAWYDYPLDTFYEEHDASTLLSCPNFGLKSLGQITFHLEEAGYDVSKFEVAEGTHGHSQRYLDRVRATTATRELRRTRELSARELIKEREKTHGPPDQTFGMAAALVSALTFDRDWTKPFAPHEIAVVNILHKVARIMQGSYHQDHWDDICGYALLGKGMHEKSDEE